MAVYTLLRIRTKQDWRKTAVIIHTAVVAAMFAYISWIWNDPSSEYPQVAWLLFFFVDFPLGCVAFLLIYVIDVLDVSIPSFVEYVVLPAIIFGTLGGLQWYWIVGWITRQNDPEPHECAGCGYDLRGSLESGRCPECGSAFTADAITDPKLKRTQPEE